MSKQVGESGDNWIMGTNNAAPGAKGNIVKQLQEWREGDQADAITLSRHEIITLLTEIERLRAPITMQDIRLCAGEGKLSAATVLQAVNAILGRRALEGK